MTRLKPMIQTEQTQGISESDQDLKIWLGFRETAIQAARTERLQFHKALEAILQEVKKLPKGSAVLEVSSRCGDASIAVHDRFPQIWVQPTEGTGQTAHGLFVLLEEHILSIRQVEREKLNEDQCRLLRPRHLDAADIQSWPEGLGHVDLHCVFTIDSVHFMSQDNVIRFLQGCQKAMHRGGLIILGGPFIDNGEASDRNLLHDQALRDFNNPDGLTYATSRGPQWRLHDVQWVLMEAKRLGIEHVTTKEIGLHDEHDWKMIVMRTLSGRERRGDAPQSLAPVASTTDTPRSPIRSEVRSQLPWSSAMAKSLAAKWGVPSTAGTRRKPARMW
jgi:hypothetical protein